MGKCWVSGTIDAEAQMSPGTEERRMSLIDTLKRGNTSTSPNLNRRG